jgi:hypothetical protein
MHDPASLVFGDLSDACAEIREMKENWNLNIECLLTGLDAYSDENESRHRALEEFQKAWDAICKNHDNAVKNLDEAAEHFNLAWPEETNPKKTIAGRALTGDTPADVPKSDNGDRLVRIWLDGVKQFTRGHQAVLDLLLQKIFSDNHENFSVNPSRAWLYNKFHQRVDSIVSYRTWVSHPDARKEKTLDYCKGLPRSVCTPILLSTGGEGVIMWLTVDLFEDGLGSFAPDIFSLGWSQIHIKPKSSNPTSQDDVSFLGSFDRMWDHSGLGKLGLSGRWRITNRPTTQCGALHLEASNISHRYLPDYSGRSAECAVLVCLLAASGFVYEPPPSSRPEKLPPRVFLNTNFAATATVNPMTDTDLRQSPLGEVFDVDRKLGASALYKLQPDNPRDPPLIDTIVISEGDYDETARDRASQVSQAIVRENEAKNSNKPEVRGVHFKPCKTIQNALDWMLSVNHWALLRREFQQTKWESQWDVVRNAQGEPIARQIDSKGMHLVVAEAQGISTGSLEYTRNPFGGSRQIAPVDDAKSP